MINREEFLVEVKDEKRFRKVLKKLLESYLKQKNEKALIEEQKFRKIIRSFIKEGLSADVADQQPQRSTGINALRRLLKNIIPILEDAYKELTTSKDQRDSFRAHILNAVENSLKPAEVTMVASAEVEEEELEEEVELDIDVEKEKFIPVRDQDVEEEEVEEDEAEIESFMAITGMDVTGRNFALTTYNKVEKQILDAYEDIAGDKQDRDEFEDYLLTNLKLYFDRFEEELQPIVPEPESPDYSPEEDENIDAGELGL